jgi:methylenetetrahydrofolate dehydrogenase (NADP+) / methenyltetrahydrofolate cyclohydrolase
MDKILDGKSVAQKIIEKLQKNLSDNSKTLNRKPRLEILSVGEDYASEKYTHMKKKLAENIGIECNIEKFPISIEEEKILLKIEEFNENKSIDGIMVQLPMPQNFNMNKILNTIDPEKDVDGLTSQNLGKIFTQDPTAFTPATPLGILKIFEEYDISLKGKRVVICGRSLIMGIPLFAKLLQQDASVSVVHSKTENIQEITSSADILISGIGKPNFFTKEFLKENSIAIDVGISQNPKTKELTGDFDYEDVLPKVKQITPVPGGVGATTVPSLMSNVLKAYLKSIKKGKAFKPSP